jgi:hypothetical protein
MAARGAGVPVIACSPLMIKAGGSPRSSGEAVRGGHVPLTLAMAHCTAV